MGARIGALYATLTIVTQLSAWSTSSQTSVKRDDRFVGCTGTWAEVKQCAGLIETPEPVNTPDKGEEIPLFFGFRNDVGTPSTGEFATLTIQETLIDLVDPVVYPKINDYDFANWRKRNRHGSSVKGFDLRKPLFAKLLVGVKHIIEFQVRGRLIIDESMYRKTYIPVETSRLSHFPKQEYLELVPKSGKKYKILISANNSRGHKTIKELEGNLYTLGFLSGSVTAELRESDEYGEKIIGTLSRKLFWH